MNKYTFLCGTGSEDLYFCQTAPLKVLPPSGASLNQMKPEVGRHKFHNNFVIFETSIGLYKYNPGGRREGQTTRGRRGVTMPVRRGVFTLKETCLRNVAQNMDSVWCEDYVKNFLDQGQYLHIVGPFEYLRKLAIS